MTRPVIILALFYAGGVLLGDWAQPPLALLFGASFALAALALCWNRAATPLLCALSLLAGWTNFAARTAILAPDDLRNLFGAGPEQITLRGTIAAQPSAKLFERGAGEQWRSSAVLDATAVCRQGRWQSAFGRAVATTSGLLDTNYFSGRAVLITGTLLQPRGPVAPGLFNARQFYGREGIHFQLRTFGTNDWSVAPDSDSAPPLAQRFVQWARKTLSIGLPDEDESLRLMWALALDWKAPITEAVTEPFLDSGTYHIFAVDGLRISILTGICVALLRALQVPRAWCGAAAIPLIWAYTGLTGWPASAVRAAIMMTVVVGGWAAKRPTDLMNSLFVAAFIILCWDPRQLFQAGFQLSFVIVFCIAALLPPAHAFIYQRLLRHDPFLPATLAWGGPEWMRDACRYCIDVLLLSWIAWLGSIPLTAHYFHLFTPWSVPANFLVVPMTALAIMGCFGSLVAGAWAPALASLFNNSAWLWVLWVTGVSQWWARWRPHAVNAAAPDGLTMAWYYLLLLTILSGWIFRTQRKRLACGAIGLATALVMIHWAVQSRTAVITVLPARGGCVVFVDHSRTLLDSGNAAFAQGTLKSFLEAQGVNRLAHFCLTSEHVEQNGGAGFVKTNFSVAETRTAAQVAAEGGVDGWTALHPGPGERHPRADDDDLVLHKELKGWSVLLLSRLGRAGQDELLSRRQTALHSDVVVSGLPAQEEPLSEPLLDAIAPKLIVIVDSENPATRRASAHLRDRLGRRGARVVFCSDAGALVIEARAGELRVKDADGQEVVKMSD